MFIFEEKDKGEKFALSVTDQNCPTGLLRRNPTSFEGHKLINKMHAVSQGSHARYVDQ